MDDTELESLFREGLRSRAGEAEVPADLVDRVVPSRGRRRLALLTAVGAAAAVVVVAVGIDAVHVGHRSDRASTRSDPAHGTATSDSNWRTEAWHGLQVSVPPDWGWGTAPVVQRGEEYLCGDAGAKVSADGRGAETGGPWVGRPIMLSDACQGGDVLTQPTSPYVWLGADLAPGTVELGNGYTQQTIEVEGTTLTVATTDAALRQRILDSATSSPCPASLLGHLPVSETPVSGGGGKVLGADMCVYQRTDLHLELVYAAHLTAARARGYTAAGRRDARTPLGHSPFSCDNNELAVIHVIEAGKDAPGTQQTVVGLDCGWVDMGVGARTDDYGRLSETTRRTITDIGGLRVVLHSEIGMLG